MIKQKNQKMNKKQLDACCNLCECEKETGKKIKVYFCPKCKSKNVGYMFNFRNAFGIMPRMQCKKCKFESTIFPQLVVSENKLKQMEKKKF